ncbi:MAG: hypothetical protein FJ271_11590 [Planctomycetes bacterium]|nr:hypothetical protein [Planctomycetota bacterium]
MTAAVEPSLVEGLERRIQRRTGWRVRNLTIEIRDDRAFMSGKASSTVSRQLAEHVLGDSCPDILIENEIEIDNTDEFLPGIPLN